MQFTPTEISDVKLCAPRVFEDDRGYFFEAFKASEFKDQGLAGPIVQENQSFTRRKFTIRGLHYQKSPQAQSKILQVLHGSIFDVAVDIRLGSPTFGKWVGHTLTSNGKEQLYIPEGFAHGFMTLEDNTEMIYRIAGGEYSPSDEGGLIWNDPTVGIEWPSDSPILIDRDANFPTLDKIDNNFRYKKG